MSEMINRVAEAMYMANPEHKRCRFDDAEKWLQEQARNMARAALEEMREPTVAMLAVGVEYGSTVAKYRAMINEALTERDTPAVIATDRVANTKCEACDGTGDFQGGRRTLQKPPCPRCNGTGVALPSQPRGAPHDD